MYFSERYPEAELYQNFHHIDSPDNPKETYSFTVKTPLDCNKAKAIHLDPCGYSITTPYGIGYITKTKVSCEYIEYEVEVVC